MSYKLRYISHKDCIFFDVKHDSQVTLFKSDTTVASSVGFCLVVKAVILGSGDLGLILSLQMPCLTLGRSLWGMPCANWAAAHPGMRL